MDDTLFEHLLNEDEGASLDFKRDQYPFAGAADETKAELLKDVLAFANGWRRTAAYILIGVEEVKGGRSLPVGVGSHLNDHELQQFVNSKTNRPVVFCYQTFRYAELQVGVLEISPQERPIYLTGRYGRLREHVVYVRRSSATDIAKPDEIAKMGAATAAVSPTAPTLAVEWGEPHTRRLLGSLTEITVDVLTPKLNLATASASSAYFGLSERSRNHARDLVEYTFESRLLRPLHVVLHNRGGVAAGQVAVVGRLLRAEGLRLTDWPLSRPQELLPDLSSMRFRSPIPLPSPDVDEHADHWALRIPFGTVLPGQTIWSESPLHIGADRPIRIDMPIHVMAENLPTPLEVMLSVRISATMRRMELRDTENPDDS